MGATLPEDYQSGDLKPSNPNQPTEDSPLGIALQRLGEQAEQISTLNAAVKQLAEAVKKSRVVDSTRDAHLRTVLDLLQ